MGTAATASLAAHTLIASAGEVGLEQSKVAYAIASGMVAVFLPYQSAPLLLARGFGFFTQKQFFKVTGLISVLLFIIVFPLACAIWLI